MLDNKRLSREGEGTTDKWLLKNVLKLEEASSLPRLDVCLMKKMAWVL